MEENLRERDRVISPHGVTGGFEISGKTPGCCIFKLKCKSTSAYKLSTCMLDTSLFLLRDVFFEK